MTRTTPGRRTLAALLGGVFALSATFGLLGGADASEDGKLPAVSPLWPVGHPRRTPFESALKLNISLTSHVIGGLRPSQTDVTVTSVSSCPMLKTR